MSELSLLLTLGAALAGSAVGAAASVMLLRRRTRQFVERSETSYMLAVKELRQVHALSIRVAERHHRQAAHAAQVERDHLQARIDEMATELVNAKEVITSLLRSDGGPSGPDDPGHVPFAPTESMGRAA